MRTVIFANGNFNPSSSILNSLGQDDLLIAADGGAHHCLESGFKPDIVIGDMDSLSPSLKKDLKEQGIRLVEHSRDKDQTDLELALIHAIKHGSQEVLFLGLLGGRLDQVLANLLLLSKEEWRNVNLIVSDEPDTAYLMRDNETISFEGNPGDLVSLIPLSEVVTGVITHGLHWPLHRSTLTLGTTLSVSNEMIDKNASVYIGSGKMYLIHRENQVYAQEE